MREDLTVGYDEDLLLDEAPEKKKKKTKGVLFLRNLNPSVKSIFHATCVRRQTNMTKVVERLMRVYIKFPERFEPTKRGNMRKPKYDLT